MHEHGKEGSRYQLRSQGVLPFYVPRGKRTVRKRSSAVVSSEAAAPPTPERAAEDILHCSAESLGTEQGFPASVGSQFLQGGSVSSDSEAGDPCTLVSDDSDTMEAPAAAGSSRDNRFSGRPGTQTLREFKAFVTSMISRFKFKHGTNYTALYMFEQLPLCIVDETLDLYDLHVVRLTETRPGPNPAHRQALQLAYDNRLAAVVAAHRQGVTAGTIDPAVTPEPTTITLTPAEMAAATVNISRDIPVPVFNDPVAEFFTVLDAAFPLKSPEKVAELSNFVRKKSETLQMMYRRMQKLRDDTQMLTDADAAVKFLDALEADTYLHFHLVNALFDRFGDTYTLTQVYETAERLELAHVHYATSHRKAYASYKGTFTPKHGHASTSGEKASTKSTTPKASKTAHAAEATSSTIRCNYCANPDHIAPQCKCPRDALYCTTCKRTSHVSAVCGAQCKGEKSFEAKKSGGNEGEVAATAGTTTAGQTSKSKWQAKKAQKNQAKTAATAEVDKVAALEATVSSLTTQLQTLSAAAKASETAGNKTSAPVNAGMGERYGFPYDVFVAQLEPRIQYHGDSNSLDCSAHLGLRDLPSTWWGQSLEHDEEVDAPAFGPTTRQQKARTVMPQSFQTLDEGQVSPLQGQDHVPSA